MKTLPVNLSDLALALEDHGGNLTVYFFDTRTGEVLILSEDVDRKRISKIAEQTSNRFVRIEPMDSHEGYRVMENFVASLPPSRLREKLEWSLDGPKPFRRFKDALREDDAIREQWFRFHEEHMREKAIEWLADRGIKPGEAPADGTEAQEEAAAPETAAEAGENWEDDDFFDEDEDEEFEEPGEFGEEEEFGVFTEEEETELMEIMEPSPGEGISFAKLHGLLTALAAGPVQASKPDFSRIILKAGWEPAADDPAKAQRISKLLEHFYDDIIDDLGSEAFVPLLEQRDIMVTDVVSDIRSWCQGFVFGMEQSRPAWQRWLKDLRRAKAISMIIGTADPDIQEKLDIASAESVAWTTHCYISDLVPLIWRYWQFESGLDELLGPEAGNSAATVGRN